MNSAPCHEASPAQPPQPGWKRPTPPCRLQ